MALLHLEGFDGINSTTGTSSNASTEEYLESRYLSQIWNGASAHPLVMPGAISGEALVLGLDNFGDDNSIHIVLPSQPQTVFVGFNYFPMRNTDKTGSDIINFRDTGDDIDTNINIQLQLGQHLRIRRGSTPIFFAINAIQPLVWQYIEMEVKISNSATGVIHIKVNGVTVLNEINVVTRNGVGQNFTDAIQFRGQESVSVADGEHAKIDDIYILDDSGPAPYNDFLGSIIVETLFPDGAGDDTDWTPSAGSNFQNVDEVVFDSDTTYNSANTSTNLDLFTVDDLAVITGTVYGVAIDNIVRVTEPGAVSFFNKVKSATTEGTGDTVGIGNIDVYSLESHIFEQDPNAAAAWTPTTVNAMQIGYEVA